MDDQQELDWCLNQTNQMYLQSRPLQSLKKGIFQALPLRGICLTNIKI